MRKSVSEAIGLIAGSYQFPLLLARRAREKGLRVVAVAIRDLTSPEIEDLVDTVEWIRLGQLGKLITVFKNAGVSRAYMAGAVRKAEIFGTSRVLKHLPDARAVRFWFQKLRDRRDATILGALADELSAEGIHLQNSVELLEDSLAVRGCMSRRKLRAREMEDVQFGWEHVRELARLDIGQSLVVKDCCVVAVEAVEGTDECIRRAGALAGPGAVLVKSSRPDQDMRFDVPCVGEQTVRTCHEAGIPVIAVEAGKTLLIDKEGMLKAADELGVSIVGTPLEEDE